MTFNKNEKIIIAGFCGAILIGCCIHSVKIFLSVTARDKSPVAHACPLSITVNINKAAKADLTGLAGIGPVSADRIIGFRAANGPFLLKEDIMKVKGIGRSKFEKIKDLIRTTDGPP